MHSEFRQRLRHLPLIGLLLSWHLMSTAQTIPPPLVIKTFTAGAESFFVVSTLVLGERDAVLVDAQFTLPNAYRQLAELIESRRVLKTIYITHAHPDHFFGIEVFLKHFPNAQVLASPQTAALMPAVAKHRLARWKPSFGDTITSNPVLARPFTGSHLEIDGQRLELIETRVAESEDAATMIHIPSIKAVIAGDVVSSGTHLWMAETNAARRQAWLDNLQTLRALNPVVVVSGHRAPGGAEDATVVDQAVAYIRDFSAAVEKYGNSAEGIIAEMKAKHGGRQLQFGLEFGAKAIAASPTAQ